MSIELGSKSDIQLVALMVAKILRDEHHIEEAPKASEYRVGEEARPNGSTDLLLSVKVDKRHSMTIRQHWWGNGDRDLENLTEAATEIAENIATVDSKRAEIAETIAEVRTAAMHQFAKARRRGLPYRLRSAEPATEYDRVADGYSIRLGVETLSRAAKPQMSIIWADCEEEIADFIERNEEAQRHLSNVRYLLDAEGATGRIDSVVVNALHAAGHDVGKVLKIVADSDEDYVDIGERGGNRQTGFCLFWENGTIYAQVLVGDGGSWSKGQLTFKETPVALEKREGQLLRDIIPEAVFGDDVRVHRTGGKEGSYGWLTCTNQALNFNAHTGALWAA